MKLGLQQSARADLQLRLSPQMLQRIEILQLASPDLQQLVEQELQENEALERVVDDEPAPVEAGADDDPWEGVDDDEDWRPAADPDRASRMDVLAATAEATHSLPDLLVQQLELSSLSEREQVLARRIVGALDDRGWLAMPLEDLAGDVEPTPSLSELEHALRLVQALEPRGVGARDLVECLLLQLDEEQSKDELLVSLVMQHLDDIARNRIPLIARSTGASVERVLAGIEVISHLDPIPGRRFRGAAAPPVHPDVVVRRVGDGYEISLENDWVPAVTVSRAVRRMSADRGLDPELRRHLREKLERAQSIVDAIEQRQHTLFRVASELVNRQADYFEQGPSGLRPLKMQEVADALGVHVSTISRAINGKYVQSPRGIEPLRGLFTGEVPAREGAEAGASRVSVQDLVRGIIAGEDPTDPLSDEAIVTLLKERHGLDIARRTVTKYRKVLGLGSSRDRRAYGGT